MYGSLLEYGAKSMPTTIKAALKKWEEASGKKSSEAKEIKLIGVYPPIEKLEARFIKQPHMCDGAAVVLRGIHATRLQRL